MVERQVAARAGGVVMALAEEPIKSNEQGIYNISLLLPGEYKLP
jgi:hypothetical protein